MTFKTEHDFELAFIQALLDHGWEEVIEYPTEADLLKNWAEILFNNNRQTDRLNGVPLTDSEMQQLIEQINTLKTPLRLNGFINGKTVSIKRDNPEDKLNCGKEISLDIYDRMQIAAGTSRYQIVRQPRFKVKNVLARERRGDLMLLINGMPVFHIELKRSGVSHWQAVNQIEKYHHHGVFSDLFALVQIFVAANPETAVYFANQPNTQGTFPRQFCFHWADFNNEPINHWCEVVAKLLSIPMAHQMLGFYTVADDGDACLKVMRSYQYFAASQIAKKVSEHKWYSQNQRGGYIWHTTGSGKTMTSFKSAQLIADSNDADKVVFLMDRIELGTQSLKEYRNFANANDDVQATENTGVLLDKLKSDHRDYLIVTSIQKMSNIQAEEGVNEADIEKVRAKRLVFIVDECHRTTFGDMMLDIKNTFPNALFFGFTGTPIMAENRRKNSETSDIFGNELHRYSLADGIRDGNVLGFDVYRVATFKESDLRREVGLLAAKAHSVSEAMADKQKKTIYLKYQNDMPMAGFVDEVTGKYVKGIEDELPKSQYQTDAHREAVISDIKEHWETLSQGGLFHAMLATSSIIEAIEYYRLLKTEMPALKCTALFDPNEGNEAGWKIKEDGLLEILQDYNERYGQHFTVPTWGKFKKDVANRIAHKETYKYLHYRKEPEKCLDLLIVVDQMLTGFDSKFVNTLYADKLMRYEKIIQAFSRTNRLFGDEKPFGTIRYYRQPYTMERNVKAAVKLFSGDREFGLFVSKLPENIRKMNEKFADISELFAACNINDFAKLPEDGESKAKFAKLFRELNQVIEAAKIQGMKWKQSVFDGIERTLDEQTYLILLQRYKELNGNNEGGSNGNDEIPFDIDPHIVAIDTGRIDSEYMNRQFDKFLKLLQANAAKEDIELVMRELHKSFASLNQEEQKIAQTFLQEIENGEAKFEQGKTMREYITDKLVAEREREISEFAERFGLDIEKLTQLKNADLTAENLNHYGRFEALKNSADKTKAKAYFDTLKGKDLSAGMVNVELTQALKKFLLEIA